MRALIVKDFESQPLVADIDKPEPGPGEVRVRVRASSVNGIDVLTAGGVLKGMVDYEFPVVLGKDFAGTIEAVGPGATRFAVGDPVFGVVMSPSPLHTRAFAEFVVVPEETTITRLPGGLDVTQAGAIGLAGTAALQSLEAVAPAAGETVLISGATGGVGSIAVQMAAARGAMAIATAKPGNDTDFVLGLGATHAVDYSGDLAAAVRAIQPQGVDVVIHLAGDGLSLSDLLSPNGRFASTLGVGPEQLAEKSVNAISIMADPNADRLNRLAEEVIAGRLRVQIQRTYSLDQTPQALADFGSGTRGKLAISID